MKRTIILGIILIQLLSSLSYSTVSKDNKVIITMDDFGNLSGYVTNPSMNPIEGAYINITCGDLFLQGISYSTGRYYIGYIPIVDCYWNVSVSKKGYEKYWIEMSIDVNTTYDFVLIPKGKTWYVDDDGTSEYTSIQDAILNANSGDTIFVHEGIYNESKIDINITINLIGENRDTTTINVNNNIDGIYIRAHNVNVSGFLIKNANRAGVNLYSNKSDNVNISNNIFTENAHGIHPYYQHKNLIISNNIFINNSNGFTTVGCINAKIHNNEFIENNWGMSIFLSSYCDIYLNNITTSKKLGIRLYGISRFNTIHHNNFIDNEMNAYFVQLSMLNKWDSNYWNKPRNQPVPIVGSIGLLFPTWINVDWHPANSPYNI